MSVHKAQSPEEERYHFIGIGGAGMSALARVLLARGDQVSGSDSAASPTLEALEAAGAQVFVGHAASHVGDATCGVFSAAVKPDNPERQEIQRRGLPILSRAELLGRLMDTLRSVGVTGAHGKSTTSGMVSALLLEAGMNPTVLLGADLPILHSNARVGDPQLVVAEVCEAYDSFLSVHPACTLITNIDADHLDYFGDMDGIMRSFRTFVRDLPASGALIGCGEDERVRLLMSEYPGQRVTYGWDNRSDLWAEDVEIQPEGMRYILHPPDAEALKVALSVPGRHNVLNSMGAMAAAHWLGLSWTAAAHAVRAFTGVSRRLERVGEGGGVTVFDDYAHHPTEVRSTLETVRAWLKPNRLITLFQPHLYSRTREHLDAFADAFTEPDYALFMDIYGAREQPIPGVTGQLLPERAKLLRPDATTEYVPDADAAVRRVLSLVAPGDVVVCLGAGDITRVAHEIGRLVSLSETGDADLEDV